MKIIQFFSFMFFLSVLEITSGGSPAITFDEMLDRVVAMDRQSETEIHTERKNRRQND
jgi:hypothetical protein